MRTRNTGLFGHILFLVFFPKKPGSASTCTIHLHTIIRAHLIEKRGGSPAVRVKLHKFSGLQTKVRKFESRLRKLGVCSWDFGAVVRQG